MCDAELLVVPIVFSVEELLKVTVLLLQQIANLFEFVESTFGIVQDQFLENFLNMIEQVLLVVA